MPAEGVPGCRFPEVFAIGAEIVLPEDAGGFGAQPAMATQFHGKTWLFRVVDRDPPGVKRDAIRDPPQSP
jgi:hypothetical protein